MKKTNTLIILCLMIAVAGLTSVATHLMWPTQDNTPEPINRKPITDQIEKLQITAQSLKNLPTELKSIQDKITQLEEKSAAQPQPSEEKPEHSEQKTDKNLEQTLNQLQNQIIEGIVSKDSLETANQLLPFDQKIAPSVLSIRDLKDKLAHLPDLTDEITVDAKPSLGEKATEILGINIRKSKTSPLKNRLSMIWRKENSHLLQS